MCYNVFMRKREQLFFSFFLFLILTCCILLLSKFGLLSTPVSLIQRVTIPMQSGILTFLTGFSIFGTPQKSLEEKTLLFKKLVDLKKIEEDNKALRDQFETAHPSVRMLLPAHVVGIPNFIPGVTSVETLTIDKGSEDKARAGMAVVYKENLVGKIVSSSPHLSTVLLITHPRFSLSVSTLQTQALGVVKGAGGHEMVLSNVLLSENLITSDVVVSYGDIDSKGIGIPKDLIVGNIIKIDKKPSALFQSAKVTSTIDFSKLTLVFILMQ